MFITYARLNSNLEGIVNRVLEQRIEEVLIDYLLKNPQEQFEVLQYANSLSAQSNYLLEELYELGYISYNTMGNPDDFISEVVFDDYQKSNAMSEQALYLRNIIKKFRIKAGLESKTTEVVPF